MTEHKIDRAEWERLRRITRERLIREGRLVEPPPAGVHNVEHDTHRMRGEVTAAE